MARMMGVGSECLVMLGLLVMGGASRDLSRNKNPPKYMIDMYRKYNNWKDGEDRLGKSIRGILPCSDDGVLEFCHRVVDSELVIKSELHLRLKKMHRSGLHLHVELVATTDPSLYIPLTKDSGSGSLGWRKFDVTDLLGGFQDSDWRLRLSFSQQKNGSSSSRGVSPRKILRMSSQPFLVLFTKDHLADFDKDFGAHPTDQLDQQDEDDQEDQMDNALKRKKRFIEISLDPEEATQHPNDIPPIEEESNNKDIDELKKKKKKYLDAGLIPMPRKNKFQRVELIKDQEDTIIVDYENDDMTPYELDKFKYEIVDEEASQDKDGGLIPYPRGWANAKTYATGKKEKKRKKSKKRGRKKKTSIIDKSKSLPGIWKSLGHQIGPVDKFSSSLCSLRSFEVSLDQVGWGNKIISPSKYQANYCQGQCTFPLTQAEAPTNHATVLSLLRETGISDGSHALPVACCVPRKMDSLTVLYFDADGSVVLKTYPNMSVKSCGCR